MPLLPFFPHDEQLRFLWNSESHYHSFPCNVPDTESGHSNTQATDTEACLKLGCPAVLSSVKAPVAPLTLQHPEKQVICTLLTIQWHAAVRGKVVAQLLRKSAEAVSDVGFSVCYLSHPDWQEEVVLTKHCWKKKFPSRSWTQASLDLKHSSFFFFQ